MSRLTAFLFVYGIRVAVCVYVTRTWWRWARRRDKIVPPRWRGSLALVGLALGSVALSLDLAFIIHAQITGGFPLFHPTLLRGIRWGGSTGLLGFVLALPGKGPLRLPAAVASLYGSLVWFAEAMAQ